DDAVAGYNIILRACRAPLTQIADNAGVDGGVICEKVSEESGNVGYNAATGKFEDLVKSGIIDPTKVTRSALQNAASVATLLLTSDALIAEMPKEEKKKGPGGSRHVLNAQILKPAKAGCIVANPTPASQWTPGSFLFEVSGCSLRALSVE